MECIAPHSAGLCRAAILSANRNDFGRVAEGIAAEAAFHLRFSLQPSASSRTISRMIKPPTIHATRVAEASRFLRVEQVDLEFSNGERRTFERLKGSGLGAVIIVPMQDADTVLLVREYAVGVDRYELGLPKGRLDRDETVEQGADRELKEEIGFGAREMHILTNLAVSPAYMTAMTHVVLARQLYPERLVGDEPEELEVVPWKLSELHRLLASPEVSDGRSIAALFIAREYLAGRFEPRR